jgi:hypothetical protein
MSPIKKNLIKLLLVTPVEAGLSIGQAKQTTRNQLSNPKKAGQFPLPIVEVGKSKRKMVRVCDIEKYVADLVPTHKLPRRGAPTKAERFGSSS